MNNGNNQNQIIGYDAQTGQPIYANQNMNQPINNVQPQSVQPQINNVQPQYNNQMYYQQPMYNQPINNAQVNMAPPMPSNFNPYVKEKMPTKRVFALIGIIVGVLLVFALIIVPLIVGMSKSMNFKANYSFENLRVYIPESWEQQEDGRYESTTKACKLGVADVQAYYDVEDLKQQYTTLFGNFGLTFNKKTINGYELDYGYVSDSNSEIYIYIISEDLGKYMIMFENNLNIVDEECSTYIEKLEKSITLKEVNR